jgi:hypothetical protein
MEKQNSQTQENKPVRTPKKSNSENFLANAAKLQPVIDYIFRAAQVFLVVYGIIWAFSASTVSTSAEIQSLKLGQIALEKANLTTTERRDKQFNKIEVEMVTKDDLKRSDDSTNKQFELIREELKYLREQRDKEYK